MGLTLAERGAVTEATAMHYAQVDKQTKGVILDELCATTGWHRGHARKADHLHPGAAREQGRWLSRRAEELRSGPHRGPLPPL